MLVRFEGVAKNFGGMNVLNRISLSIEEGKTHALIGPNGAGKTTLFNLLTGLTRLDAGQIHYRKTPIQHLPAHFICRLGIARTFQNIRLFKTLTALENVMVGRHIKTVYSLLSAFANFPNKWRKEQEILRRAHEFLEFVGLSGKAHYRARELSYGEQRRLEVARALATEPSLLLLDEPTAGMTEGETMEVIELIRRIEKSGVTVFFIEHDMRFVMNISQKITVLNFGNVIAEGDAQAIQNDPKVIEAYLGRREDFSRAPH
jgi:branched-chain amino acid transport system ATP-binding protein